MCSLSTLLVPKHKLFANTSQTCAPGQHFLAQNMSSLALPIILVQKLVPLPSTSTAALFCPAKVSELPESQKCLQQCSAQFTLHLRSNTSRTWRPLGVMHYLHFIAYMKSAVFIDRMRHPDTDLSKGLLLAVKFLEVLVGNVECPMHGFLRF